jgi:membrane protein implicated in regulation of membrane protease activity
VIPVLAGACCAARVVVAPAVVVGEGPLLIAGVACTAATVFCTVGFSTTEFNFVIILFTALLTAVSLRRFVNRLLLDVPRDETTLPFISFVLIL